MTVAEIQCAFLTRGYDLGSLGADGDALGREPITAGTCKGWRR